MQTTPKSGFLNKLSFFDRHAADIIAVSLGALAIVVFLSVAFIWFDATSLPGSNSMKGTDNHGVIDGSRGNHGVIEGSRGNHGVIEGERDKQREHDPSEDLIAAATPTLQKRPLRFVSATSGLSKIPLNATLTLDNTMWRYTKDGWNDISMAADPPPVNKPLLEGVHPVIWTAMLLLSSLLLLIMAASDEEIRNLLGLSGESTKKS